MHHRAKCFASWVGLLAGVLLVLGTEGGEPEAASVASAAPVVFVCEHGTVKSLIAVELFNREAARRGVPFRAVSRGIEPDKAVPPEIAVALKKDGFEVTDFEPRKISSGDIITALQVVSIGADLSPWNDDAMVPILSWEEIPPASVDYEASRAALLVRVQALLDTLEKQPR